MHHLLRKYPVNILRYLPEFLARDPSFKAAADSTSKEHENNRQLLVDIANQMIVEKSTWGLDDWEQVLGIHQGDKDIIERRAEIKMRLKSTQTTTQDFTTELASKFCTAPAKVEVIPEQYTLNVIIKKGSCNNIPELCKAIETYKPAHLKYLLYEEIRIQTDIYLFNIALLSENMDIPQGAGYTIDIPNIDIHLEMYPAYTEDIELNTSLIKEE